MLYGSLCYHAAMPIYDCSHQLGKGQSQCAEMPVVRRPSRLVLGGYSLGAFMSDNYHPHQLGEGQSNIAKRPTVERPPRLVRERPQIRHRNDTVCTPFPISFMEVNNSQQRCHPDTTSKGKGHGIIAEMPRNKRPSQPVYGPTQARRNATELTPTS